MKAVLINNVIGVISEDATGLGPNAVHTPEMPSQVDLGMTVQMEPSALAKHSDILETA